ncbi:uncharacterized protein RJT20DRAFT_58067 [Scheffersomyces xylosifermentans]|uniref:uncharacterized protein n=1 Tax=Scheffersomyces xylosifermentans TaxID=1304137 RepID=UPI00315CF22B
MSRPSSSSLSSLSSSESARGQEENVPVQLDEATRTASQQQRRGSLFRRLSNATSGYFTLSSDQREQVLSEEEDEYLELVDRRFTNQDWFGQDQLRKSFSRVADMSSQEDLEEFPQLFDGIESVPSGASLQSAGKADIEELPPITRRRSTVVSTIQTITKKLGFWDEEFHADRIKIVLTFANNYLYLIIGFCLALCIYWGSYYNRASRYKNLKFAVVNADTQVGELPAIVGPIVSAFFNLTAVKTLGHYDMWDFERISTLANSHNNTITEEVYRQVHHEKYWGAFYIKPNTTLDWVEALTTLSSFDPTNYLEVVFETGRDYNAVSNYISTIINNILKGYYAFVPQTPLAMDLLSTLNSTQAANVIANAPGLITILPTFNVNDRLPVPDQIVQAPLQIGIIYLVIFSFFQFIFQIEIHMYMAKQIKGFKYVAYRMAASQVAYLVLSLAFVTLNHAYGLTYYHTFGRSGFLVIWVFGYLLMSSLGSLIEVSALFLMAVKPQLIGFLLLFIAVLNLSPTVSPIVLCPPFYRYGYAIPVRNAYELLHVAYFNAYKGKMRRNIGILFAWIVVTNAMLPFMMKWMATRKAAADASKGAEAAAAAQAKSETAK